MPDKQRFRYIAGDPARFEASLLPQLELTLISLTDSVRAFALLDTGSTVNVLSYSVGTKLGLKWDEAETQVRLGGNIGRFEARAVALGIMIGQFAPVELAFAWTRTDNVPIILGQYDFFMKFDVCFFRSDFAFEIEPRE